MKNKHYRIVLVSWILLIVITISLFLFGLSAKADTQLVDNGLEGYPSFPSSITENDYTYSFYDYFIEKRSSSTIYLYCYSSPGVKFYYNNLNQIIYRGPLIQSDYFIFELKNDSWVYTDTHTLISDITYSIDPSTLLYCSIDIYSNSDFDDLVFQGAPPISLVGLTPKQIVSSTMKEILCLVPLSIGFLILVIGLRKGLKMLFQRLRRA